MKKEKTMEFNLDNWKSEIASSVNGWTTRFKRAGFQSIYYFLAAITFLPVVQAANRGDWTAIALLGGTIGGAVGTNLLANILQKNKDSSEEAMAVSLQMEAVSKPALDNEINILLEKLEVLQQATKGLDEADLTWFRNTLSAELSKKGDSKSFQAFLVGSGAISQGDNAISLGKNAVYINTNPKKRNKD